MVPSWLGKNFFLTLVDSFSRRLLLLIKYLNVKIGGGKQIIIRKYGSVVYNIYENKELFFA